MNSQIQSPVIREHFHGSDLEKIEKIYGISPKDIVSFSANVNPLGLPGKVKRELMQHIDVLTSYPDREYTGLRKVIGDYCGVPFSCIAVGNGSSELISLYINVLSPKNALILGPTYSEYENEVRRAGGNCSYFELREEDSFVLDKTSLLMTLSVDNAPKTDEKASAPDAGDSPVTFAGSPVPAHDNPVIRSNDNAYDLLVICNPNNPTSGALDTETIREIADFCALRGIFVLIDETYVEFAENADKISAVSLVPDHPNIAVLRGVSKFFSAPGLRLGYSLCSNDDIRGKVVKAQVPWSINSLAECAGRLMFTDEDFKTATTKLIRKERDRMYKRFLDHPAFRPYPPCANFILVKILKPSLTASAIFDAAIREGLMIRDCSTFVFLDSSFFRFCLLTEADNDRLWNCISRLAD